MKPTAWVAGACMAGGLAVLAVGVALGVPPETADARVRETTAGVVINEVAWMGTAAGTYDEWIELHNTAAVTVSLDGWHLIDDDDLDIALHGEISPQGYYLIERTDDSAVSDVPADWTGSFGSGLSNSGEVLTLTDHLGAVVDTANGDGGPWPAGTTSTGIVPYATMERIDPHGADTDANWCANDGVTRNGHDAVGNPINGTPRAPNSCYQPPTGPGADLTVAKSGPLAVEPGDPIVYQIVLSNTGSITAAATVLTDVLPAGIGFVGQSSPFTFTRDGPVLVWQLGHVPSGTLQLITLTGQVSGAAAGPLTNRITATTATSETVVGNNTGGWTTMVGAADVLVSAVLYDGYQSLDADEAVQLINVGTAPADLSDWQLCDEAAGGSCAAIPSTTLLVGQRIWLAWRAVSFTLSFGYPPDYEVVDTDPAVPNLGGSWPRYSNTGDEVVLRDGTAAVVDAVVYEDGNTSTVGWSGTAVRPYGNWGHEGQVLYRVPDETTGRPTADTDTAADWVQTATRQVLYPGWDLDPLFWPLQVTEPATVVVGVAPDSAFDVVAQLIAQAQHAITIEVYSLSQPDVVAALLERAQAGVDVVVLLEGRPAFVSFSDPSWQQELWACQQVESAGGQCWFMIHDTGADIFSRYDYIHSKLIIVDDRWVLVGSQNLSLTSLPSDDRSNGTYGSRGAVVATSAPTVVARAAQVLALDLDPAHHADLLRWSPVLTGTYGPPVVTYTPQTVVPDYTTTTVAFPDPLVVSGSFGFELFTAPEAALRQSDALLGLVARAGAGDAVYIEQLYEHWAWGDDPVAAPNPRLEAYVDAARRGATVRILLNGGTFDQVGFQNVNTATVAYVNGIARAEGLDLEAAVGDPTQYGIHNKMVLVWLHDEGGYAHVGSLNGSESSSKVNREMVIQIRSDQVFAYLLEVFQYDWRLSRPLFLPLLLQQHVPPADHLLLSEVAYLGSCEWVEVFNPTAVTVTLTGYRVGDAQRAAQYEGMYVFPQRSLAPGEVLLVAGDATGCNLAYVPVAYEMFGSHPAVPNLTRDPSWGTGDFGLGNSGDEVLLLDPSRRVVDVVIYAGGSYDDVVPHPGVEWGDTLERIPAFADTDDCSRDFRAGWSPGWVRLE
jgi:uncharacterized repeat protein (TIGR01451 family)